jgi:hypothetical protein
MSYVNSSIKLNLNQSIGSDAYFEYTSCYFKVVTLFIRNLFRVRLPYLYLFVGFTCCWTLNKTESQSNRKIYQIRRLAVTHSTWIPYQIRFAARTKSDMQLVPKSLVAITYPRARGTGSARVARAQSRRSRGRRARAAGYLATRTPRTARRTPAPLGSRTRTPV